MFKTDASDVSIRSFHFITCVLGCSFHNVRFVTLFSEIVFQAFEIINFAQEFFIRNNRCITLGAYLRSPQLPLQTVRFRTVSNNSILNLRFRTYVSECYSSGLAAISGTASSSSVCFIGLVAILMASPYFLFCPRLAWRFVSSSPFFWA